jgi:hypothetical protein
VQKNVDFEKMHSKPTDFLVQYNKRLPFIPINIGAIIRMSRRYKAATGISYIMSIVEVQERTYDIQEQ